MANRMMQGLRLAVSLSVLLLAPAALANPGVQVPEGSTVVIVTPPAVEVTVDVAPAQAAPPYQAPPYQAAPYQAAPYQAAPYQAAPYQAAPYPVAPGALPGVYPVTPPQNQPWSNVSHINGTPVPVGERGEYLYKWKKTNIATNPFGWMMGFWGLSVSQAISDNIAIRGDANLRREIDDSRRRGYELGATLPIYFRRVFSGPMLEPGLIIRDWDTTDTKGAFTGLQVNVGWHWTFDSGLNVAAAFGLARRITEQTVDPMSDDESYSIEPVGYFRVGYAL